MTTAPIPRTAALTAAIDRAREEARHLGHRRVGSEHLLLALLATGDGVASIMAALHLSLEPVRAAVAELMPGIGRPTEGELPLTESASGALDKAAAAAHRLGAAAVDTPHLLLGIAQQHQGIGSRVLTDMGATAEKIRGLVEREAAAQRQSICGGCGAGLAADWRFCPYCGLARTAS